MKLANRAVTMFGWKGVLLLLGFLLAYQPAAWSAGVVIACDWPALQAALRGGGRVTFACDGTIEVPEIVLSVNFPVIGT